MFSAAYRLQRRSSTRLAGWECVKISLGTAASRVAGLATTTTLASLDALVRPANIAVVATADAADGSGVAKVGVNTNKVRSHSAGANILNYNFAWAPSLVVGAIAAASVEFARVGDSIVADSHTPAAVGLDYFVGCAISATALNKNSAWSKSSNSV